MCDLISILAENLSIPVTCKIRVFDNIDETVVMAKRLEKAGYISRHFCVFYDIFVGTFMFLSRFYVFFTSFLAYQCSEYTEEQLI